MSLTCTVTLTCDTCGAALSGSTGPRHTPVQAARLQLEAAWAGWVLTGGKYLCPKCHSLPLVEARRENGMINLSEDEIREGNT